MCTAFSKRSANTLFVGRNVHDGLVEDSEEVLRLVPRQANSGAAHPTAREFDRARRSHEAVGV
jgi:hypothetical protein